MTPDLTLYVGNTYSFDLSDSSNDDQEFAFSSFPGGKWGVSRVGTLTSTLDVGSANITVTSTAGIVSGMLVTATGQDGGAESFSNTDPAARPVELQINELIFPPRDLISTISVLDPCATPLSIRLLI